MAKKNNGATAHDMEESEMSENEVQGATGETFEKPPTDLEGYQDVAAERSDGWYQAEEGSWFQGRLMGRYEMSNQRNNDGSPRAFYQVRVKRAAAYMMVGKGKDAVRTKVEPGAILAFDERKAMQVLKPYADSDGTYNVFVHAVAKEPVSGTNKTFWKFTVKTETVRPPKTPLASRPVHDDVPF